MLSFVILGALGNMLGALGNMILGTKIQRLKFIAGLMYFSLTNPFVTVWKTMMKNQSRIILVVSYVNSIV